MPSIDPERLKQNRINAVIIGGCSMFIFLLLVFVAIRVSPIDPFTAIAATLLLAVPMTGLIARIVKRIRK